MKTRQLNGCKMIIVLCLCMFILSVKTQAQDCMYGTQLAKIDHFLDSVIATQWITHYSTYVDSVQKGVVKFDPTILLSSSESFNSRYIQKILSLSGCIGERVYLGINDQEKMVVIMGGVDSCGRTLYITNDAGVQSGGQKNIHLFIRKTDGGGGLVEFGQKP